MAVIIKGRLIDAKNPLICVPVMGESATEIIKKAAELAGSGVEMIEWRADFFDGLSDSAKVREVLEKLQEIAQKAILLVTVRTKSQGGHAVMSEEELRTLLIEIAQAHAADLIDVEYFSFEAPGRVIERLQERGALVVLSHHDFNETPKRAVMRTLLSDMAELDADIIKLAVMPVEMQDVSNLLSITAWFSEENPGTPIITMSMGASGVLSRVGGFMFGSCVTFASDGDATSAPGQLPYTDVSGIIGILKSL